MNSSRTSAGLLARQALRSTLQPFTPTRPQAVPRLPSACLSHLPQPNTHSPQIHSRASKAHSLQARCLSITATLRFPRLQHASGLRPHRLASLSRAPYSSDSATSSSDSTALNPSVASSAPSTSARASTPEEPPPTSEPTTAPGAEPAPPTPQDIPGPQGGWVYQNVARPMLAPFHAYARAQARRPYVVQFLSALVIYFLGDLSAQYITRPRTREALASSDSTPDSTCPAPNNGPDSAEPTLREYYDPWRAGRSLIIGGVAAIPSFHWHVYLSHSFNVRGSRLAALALKILVQQFFYTPVFNTYFFFMQALLAPQPLAPSVPPGSAAGASAAPSTGRQPERALAATRANLAAAAQRVLDTVPVSWINSFKFWPVVTAISFTFVPIDMRSVFAGAAAVGWNSYLMVLNQRAVDAQAQARARARAADPADPDASANASTSTSTAAQ